MRAPFFGPPRFKTLVFLQIENHEHTVIREFIVANMIRALDSMPAAPVGVMVDPLVKMTSLHGYANLDFDLFIALAKHPRLGLKQAIQLLDLLGIMCLNDPVFGRAASVPFLIVVNRLHAQRQVSHTQSHAISVTLLGLQFNLRVRSLISVSLPVFLFFVPGR